MGFEFATASDFTETGNNFSPKRHVERGAFCNLYFQANEIFFLYDVNFYKVTSQYPSINLLIEAQLDVVFTTV